MAPRKVGCATERWHQFRLLTKKNFIILLRNKSATIVQILVPILFILLLFLLQLAQKDNDKYSPIKGKLPESTSQSLSTLPKCVVGKGKSRCWTVGYTKAGDPVVEAVMATLVAQNNLGPDDVIAFSTESESDNFLQQNPNTTQGVYQFVVDYGCDMISSLQSVVDACYAASHNTSQVRGLKYVVQYNQTSIYNGYYRIDTWTGIYLPYVNAIERAIFATFGDGMQYDFSVSKMAHPALPRFNIIAMVGPGVIFAAVMFNLVIQAGLIVAEKELKLRESMRVMGLIDGVYWLSWIVLNMFMNIVAAFLLIAAGHVFRLPMFVRNDFGTYAVLFLLFSIAMVPVGLLLAALVNRSSTATTAGFAVFLVGSLIQSFAGILYLESSGLAAATFFSLFPFVVFGKGLADLATATTNEYQTGIRWRARFDNDWWPLQKTYYFLILDFFIYLVIAIYVDNVTYSKRPWYFIVSPSYWTGSPPKRKTKKDKDDAKIQDYEVDGMDDDVAAEEMMIKEGESTANKAVVLDQLSMTYSKNRYLCVGKVSFRAVKDVCVTMDHGQLFCLLGHNGAGKSTTIGMLTGLLTPTGGDATILGHSIIDEMDQIRENMGVCPQHDVLWAELTAREHLELYAGFKRLYYDEMEKDVAERLEDVALTAAANTPCGNYSGGMKRRLSVSIALIGDPKIVFLDEPTTGMDPVSRRQVWNLIERVKRGRVTLLTTHSMEEADVLGDRIAIMKAGRLASLGTSLHLKRKYGNGYKVFILSDPAKQSQMHEYVVDFFDSKSPATPTDSADVREMETQSNDQSGSKSELPLDENHKTNSESASSTTNTALPKPKSKSSTTGGSRNVETIEDGTDKETENSAHVDDRSVALVNQDGSVSQYQVPTTYHNYLSDFFRALEKKKAKFGINNVQLAMTTLEDVFLRVAEQGEHVEKKKVLTKEERAQRRRKRCWKIFWILFIIFCVIGAAVAIGLGVYKPKAKIPATRARSQEPPTYVPTDLLDLYSFPSALQVTDVSTTTAFISAYVTSPLALTLQLMEGSETDWTYVPTQTYTRDPLVVVNDNGRAHISILGLKPDTVYNAWFVASNGSRSDVTRFRTATAIGQGWRNVTIGATSSFGKSGYPYRSVGCAADYKLDAFLLVGDLVFSEPGDDLETRINAYNTLLASDGFKALSQSTSLIATWNDQEVKQRWNRTGADSGLLDDVDSAMAALEQTFPHLPGPAGLVPQPAQPLSSLWRSISWGENLEVFVLDLQYERNDTQLMSVNQMNWLKQALKTSRAKFKVIMSSISMTDTSGLLIRVENSWISAPEAVAQRKELIDWITNQRVEGVLFVSGGSQFGLMAHVEPTANPDKAPEWSSWNITESVVGPAGTFINPQVLFNPRIAFASEQFDAIIDSYNTVIYNFDPARGVLDVKYLDEKCLVAFSESFEIASDYYEKDKKKSKKKKN